MGSPLSQRADAGNFGYPVLNEILNLIGMLKGTSAKNFLANPSGRFAQRQAPGTLTTIADNKYGFDRWKCSMDTSGGASLQTQRQSGIGVAGITSQYSQRYKNLAANAKFMVFQPLEGAVSQPLLNQD